MMQDDISHICKRLHDVYGEKFIGYHTPGMALFWLERLGPFEPYVVTTALNEWIADHPFRVPSVSDIEYLAAEIVEARDIMRKRQATRDSDGMTVGT